MALEVPRAPEAPLMTAIVDPDLTAYLGERVFTNRRWTIGGVVSLAPAPPPRRQSMSVCSAPCPINEAPSSRWRCRRYSFGGSQTVCATNSSHGDRVPMDLENANPQHRFVTMRGKRETSPKPGPSCGRNSRDRGGLRCISLNSSPLRGSAAAAAWDASSSGSNPAVVAKVVATSAAVASSNDDENWARSKSPPLAIWRGLTKPSPPLPPTPPSAWLSSTGSKSGTVGECAIVGALAMAQAEAAVAAARAQMAHPSPAADYLPPAATHPLSRAGNSYNSTAGSGCGGSSYFGRGEDADDAAAATEASREAPSPRRMARAAARAAATQELEAWASMSLLEAYAEEEKLHSPPVAPQQAELHWQAAGASEAAAAHAEADAAAAHAEAAETTAAQAQAEAPAVHAGTHAAQERIRSCERELLAAAAERRHVGLNAVEESVEEYALEEHEAVVATVEGSPAEGSEGAAEAAASRALSPSRHATLLQRRRDRHTSRPRLEVMIPADDITSADEAAAVVSVPSSSEAVRMAHPDPDPDPDPDPEEGPAVCARSRCSSSVEAMDSPRPAVDAAPHTAPPITAPIRPSAEPLPSSRQLQPPPSAPCAVGVPIPPSAGRPRSLRRSTGMLRLYTSPRTPADSTRQLRRGSGGEASYPPACAPCVCANGAAPSLPSGVVTRPPPTTAPAWAQPIISPGHSLFSLQGHTLKPTREGLVPVAAAPAAGACVETPAAWSQESIWLENGSTLPTSVTVRQQAAKQSLHTRVFTPEVEPNGSDAVRPPTPGRPTLA